MPSSGDALNRALFTAALMGAVGVALGAFGAHGLEGRVTPDRLATWETAVRYHLVHALALLAACGAPPLRTGPTLPRLTVAWSLGTVLFSGSLYLLVLLDLGILGAVTPLGGIVHIAGWILLAVAAARGSGEPRTPSAGPQREHAPDSRPTESRT